MSFDTKAAPYRAEILWWEICCLLHDIGKLSDEFLFYRQHWHRMPAGYLDGDLHDHEWLTHDSLLDHEFPSLKTLFETPIKVLRSSLSGTLSAQHAAHDHVGDPLDDLARILKLADGLDARDDRNNPLIGCEQTNHADPDKTPEIFRSNVFGYEGDRMRVPRGRFQIARSGDGRFREALWNNKSTHTTEGLLHRTRRRLYDELEKILPGMLKSPGTVDYSDYRKVRNLLEKYFEPGLSDTTRPNNDTSLWEHVYSVTSIAKALHIQSLWTGKVPGHATFHLWGIGFDALRYISYGHKIGDITGRRVVVDDIFDKVERFIEWKLPLGNRVYRDDNFLLFLTPAIDDGEFGAFKKEVEDQVSQISLDGSDGEIIPQFHWTPNPVSSLTAIVSVLNALRDRIATPFRDGAARIHKSFEHAWNKMNSPDGICPVCRLRPAKRGDDGRLVCSACIERRRKQPAEDNRDPAGPQETKFIEEIADRNGRAALIVARIGLREWLDGRMVRTCLITEPNAIKKTIGALQEVTEQDLKSQGATRKSWFASRPSNNFAQILDEVAECKANCGGEALFLYGRHIQCDNVKAFLPEKLNPQEWEKVLTDGKTEHPWHKLPDQAAENKFLANLLCAKTPTPSTVLDVWRSARRFFESVVHTLRQWGSQEDGGVFVETTPLLLNKDLNGKLHTKQKSTLLPRKRSYFEVDQTPQCPENMAFEADIAGRRRSLVFAGGNRIWLLGETYNSNWNDAALAVPNSQPLKITGGGVTPDAFYPYRTISVSPNLLLLIVPADAAVEVTRKIHERFAEEFGKVYGRLPISIGNIVFHKFMPMFSVLDAGRRMAENFRRLQEGIWLQGEPPRSDLPDKLGDGQCDYHHPYFLLADGTGKDPVTDFETAAGRVAHMSQLNGRNTRYRPNWYDCEMLGASADRFKIQFVEPDASALDWNDDPAKQKKATRQTIYNFASRGDPPSQWPITLEEFEHMAEFWDVLRGEDSTATDASIRNLEYLIAAKRERWRNAPRPQAETAIQALARSILTKFTGFEVGTDEYDHVLDTVSNGVFDRSLNLYLRILKDRLKTETQPGEQL